MMVIIQSGVKRGASATAAAMANQTTAFVVANTDDYLAQAFQRSHRDHVASAPRAANTPPSATT